MSNWEDDFRNHVDDLFKKFYDAERTPGEPREFVLRRHLTTGDVKLILNPLMLTVNDPDYEWILTREVIK